MKLCYNFSVVVSLISQFLKEKQSWDYSVSAHDLVVTRDG